MAFTNDDMRTLEGVLSELHDIRAALRMIGIGGLEQQLLTMENRIRLVAKANCPPLSFDATAPVFGVAA